MTAAFIGVVRFVNADPRNVRLAWATRDAKRAVTLAPASGNSARVLSAVSAAGSR